MIRLEKQNGCWIADYSKASNASEIFSLFGTCHLPTAYTDKSSAERVLKAIQALNDEQVIVVQ